MLQLCGQHETEDFYSEEGINNYKCNMPLGLLSVFAISPISVINFNNY